MGFIFTKELSKPNTESIDYNWLKITNLIQQNQKQIKYIFDEIKPVPMDLPAS